MPAPQDYRPRVGKRRRGGQMVLPDGGTLANSAYSAGKRVKRVSRTQMQYQRKTLGRFVSWSRKLNSLMKAQTYSLVDRWQYLTNTYDNGGQFPLSYYTHNSQNTVYTYPVYLFELNSLPFGNENGTTRYSMPMTRLFRVAGGNYTFLYNGLTGWNADFTQQQFGWQVEQRSVATTDITAENAFLDWIDFRLMINGPRKTHSRVTVQIVRFPDDDCQPEAYKTIDGAATATLMPTGAVTSSYGPANVPENIAEWNNMWQETVAPLISNPLSTRPLQASKRLQVLKSWTYEFQPRDTSEDAPVNGAGDVIACKFRYGVGKTFRYRKGTTAATQVVAAEEQDANEFPVISDLTEFQVHARPKARLFLLVKGYTPSSGAAPVSGTEDFGATTARFKDYDFMPSFDLLCRRKWILTR